MFHLWPYIWQSVWRYVAWYEMLELEPLINFNHWFQNPIFQIKFVAFQLILCDLIWFLEDCLIPKRLSKLWLALMTESHLCKHCRPSAKPPADMLRQLYSCLLSSVPQSACLSVYHEIAVSSQPPAPHTTVMLFPPYSLSFCRSVECVQRLLVQGFSLCNTSCLRL